MNARVPQELDAAIAERNREYGNQHFAERFVAGREFNVALLGRSDAQPQVLPVAEIEFCNYAPEKPRIVDWRAKWVAASFEYQNTPRRFDFAKCDAGLVAHLEHLATDAWHTCGLRGYARVDFRVDARGAPWILEVNANPCLAPDAGFAAALAADGISYTSAMTRIVALAATDADGAH